MAFVASLVFALPEDAKQPIEIEAQSDAVECECIPIVENAYKYYDRLFPNNPFLKVDKWQEAKLLIKDWKRKQISAKREECKAWWKKYKNQLQKFIKQKIYS